MSQLFACKSIEMDLWNSIYILSNSWNK